MGRVVYVACIACIACIAFIAFSAINAHYRPPRYNSDFNNGSVLLSNGSVLLSNGMLLNTNGTFAVIDGTLLNNNTVLLNNGTSIPINGRVLQSNSSALLKEDYVLLNNGSVVLFKGPNAPPVDETTTAALAAMEFIKEKNEIIDNVTDVLANNTELLHQTNDRMQERTKELMKEFMRSVERPRDCKKYALDGFTQDGVYMIYPPGEDEGVEAWCDMTTTVGGPKWTKTDYTGWTVILTRQQQESPVDFGQPWQAYVDGFGTPSGEYWLGNRYIHALTINKPTVLRLDVNTSDGSTRFAEWQNFNVGDEESKFLLRASTFNYESTLGNVMNDQHDGQKFSTLDQDNDAWDRSCSQDLGGGGWWYKDCRYINPTAPLSTRTASKYNEAHTYFWDGETEGGRWTTITWMQAKIWRID